MATHEITLTDDHKTALDRIRDDAYPHESMSDVIMSLIEDYILREDGRIGKFKNSTYYEDA